MPCLLVVSSLFTGRALSLRTMYLSFPIRKTQALFNKDASILGYPSALPCPCPCFWLAGLTQLRLQLPFTEDFGRFSHLPEEKQGALFDSTPDGNARIDGTDILLNTMRGKEKADSQPSLSPGEKMPRCNEVLMSIFCMNFLGPNG